MAADIEFHEAANIFPMMTDDESNGLLEDIEKHGLMQPVELFEDKILDGRNRYLVCLKLGMECDFYELENVTDPVAHVLSANLYRRHLDTSQRAMVGARTKEVYDKQAKKRQGKRNDIKNIPVKLPGSLGDSRDVAGAAVKVSGKTIDHAVKVIEKGTSALAKAVDAGELPVSKAAKIAELPKAEQPKAIKEAKQPKSAKKYPHSDQFHYWLSSITAQMTVMKQRHETVAAMVEKDGWDKKETKEIASRLRDVLKTLSQYEKDFRNYVNNK